MVLLSLFYKVFYSAGFAAILGYSHTWFPVTLFPAKMKEAISLFVNYFLKKEEITEKIDTLSTSCIVYLFSYQMISLTVAKE